MKRLAIIAALGAAAATAQEQRPTASVLDPKVSKGVGTEEAEIIGEAIRDAVVATARYRVQDRAAMREILAQQQLNASEACDESCIVEQGRMLQVRFLVSSTMRRAEGMTVISVRMTDVESGEVRGTARDSCQGCGVPQQMRMAEALAHEVVTGQKRAPTVAPLAPAPQPQASQAVAPPQRAGPPPPAATHQPSTPSGLRASAALGYLMPAGMVFAEAGLGQWSARAGAGGGVDPLSGDPLTAVGVAGRFCRDGDGGGWFLEGGAAFLSLESTSADVVDTLSVTIFYGMGGWRWQADAGLYFQLGGGAIVTADTDVPLLPTLNLELGWSLWFSS